jgi:thiosulfate dehydrogenase (quinone) large subunit
MNALPSAMAYARWLAILRIVTGGMWLCHAIPKFVQSDDFMPPTGAIVGFINKAMQNDSAPAAYHAFLANIVLPNIGIFAELVRLGELMVGVSLVLGVLTRLGGLGGMLLTLNYMAAGHGFTSFAAWSSEDAQMLMLSAVNLVLPTGRVWGIDMFFGKHAEPPPATVRAVFVDEPPMTGPTASTTATTATSSGPSATGPADTPLGP